MKNNKLKINAKIEFTLEQELLDCFKPLRDVDEFSEFVWDSIINSMFSHLVEAEYINDVYEIEDIFLKEKLLKYQSAYSNLV